MSAQQTLIPARSPPLLAWIVGIAVVLFCMAGIAALTGWIPDSIGGVVGKTGIDATATVPVKAASSSPAKSQSAAAAAICAYCGVIVSMRDVAVSGEGSGLGGAVVTGNEVDKRVKSGKSTEITVRFDDGTARVIQAAHAGSWQTGDHVKVVDGALERN